MWNPLGERERRLHTLYPDIAPEPLLNQYGGKNISADAGELQRAQWFWGRRPKMLILTTNMAIRIVTFYLLLWTTSIFTHNQAQATAAVVDIGWAALAASAAAVFVDISRYAQWKWEYRSAIARLCTTAYR
jgi:hypothetical protein